MFIITPTAPATLPHTNAGHSHGGARSGAMVSLGANAKSGPKTMLMNEAGANASTTGESDT
eukprot:7265219-Lingulodinium_polyedra.AAC.1